MELGNLAGKVTMKTILGSIASLLVGCIVAAAVAGTGILVARALWPGYAAAEPLKHFTLTMLVARLTVGAVATAIATCATTMMAGDTGQTARRLGVLLLVISLPVHLFYVWNDYPPWYHAVYLGSLIPVTIFAAWAFLSCRERSKKPGRGCTAA